MSKVRTLKTAFYHSSVLSFLIFAMIPLYRLIYGSPLHRFFATRIIPEAVGGFIGDSYGRVIYGLWYTVADGVAYVDNVLSLAVTYFPIYIVALISIFVFLRFKSTTCSIFALPISFILSPFLLFFWGFVFLFINISAMSIASFWHDMIMLYSVPMFVVTFCIAIYITIHNKKKLNTY